MIECKHLFKTDVNNLINGLIMHFGWFNSINNMEILSFNIVVWLAAISGFLNLWLKLQFLDRARLSDLGMKVRCIPIFFLMSQWAFFILGSGYPL
jgi:hypothetical protein